MDGGAEESCTVQLQRNQHEAPLSDRWAAFSLHFVSSGYGSSAAPWVSFDGCCRLRSKSSRFHARRRRGSKPCRRGISSNACPAPSLRPSLGRRPGPLPRSRHLPTKAARELHRAKPFKIRTLSLRRIPSTLFPRYG